MMPAYNDLISILRQKYGLADNRTERSCRVQNKCAADAIIIRDKPAIVNWKL